MTKAGKPTTGDIIEENLDGKLSDVESNIRGADADDLKVLDDHMDDQDTAMGTAITTIEDRLHEVHDVVIYPVAKTGGTTPISDDGSSPSFEGEEDHTGDTDFTEAWNEDIDFEQDGALALISIFMEIHLQIKISGGATGTVKLQISGDAGGSWVDVTDDLTTVEAAYVDKTRIGTGLWITGIVAGANQLKFRLMHKTSDAGETVYTQIRTDTYSRISYRKS